jgi:hypothetical protein
MNKFEAWTITLCVLAAMAAIPATLYRWALVGLIVVPVGVALMVALL